MLFFAIRVLCTTECSVPQNTALCLCLIRDEEWSAQRQSLPDFGKDLINMVWNILEKMCGPTRHQFLLNSPNFIKSSHLNIWQSYAISNALETDQCQMDTKSVKIEKMKQITSDDLKDITKVCESAAEQATQVSHNISLEGRRTAQHVQAGLPATRYLEFNRRQNT